MFKTTYESQPCECGGRHNLVPSVVLTHRATKRHQNWELWKSLCIRMLDDISKEEKRAMLKELKVLATLVS